MSNIEEQSKSFSDWLKNDSPKDFVKATDHGEENPDYDALIDEALLSVDNGHITPDSESIIAWAKGQGLSDARAQELASEVMNMTNEHEDRDEEDEQEGLIHDDDDEDEDDEDDEDEDEDEDDEDEDDYMKSAAEAVRVIRDEVEEVSEFAKSASAFQEETSDSMATLNVAVTGLIRKSKEQSETIEFLKSEIVRLGGQSAGPKKSPVVAARDAKELGAGEGRGEILQIIRKGVADKVLETGDVLAFESKGVMTPQVERLVASVRGK